MREREIFIDLLTKHTVAYKYIIWSYKTIVMTIDNQLDSVLGQGTLIKSQIKDAIMSAPFVQPISSDSLNSL